MQVRLQIVQTPLHNFLAYRGLTVTPKKGKPHKPPAARIQIIDRTKFTQYPGRLAARLGRTVSWAEISSRTGVSQTTLCNIRKGRTGGSVDTAQALARFANAEGVEMTYTDLLVSGSTDSAL